MRSVLLIVLLILPFLGSTQIDNLRNEINKIIRYDLDFSMDQIPVCMIGIIDGDSTFFLDVQNTDSIINVDADTPFEVGSITKVFTSSLLWILEHKSILNRQDLVNDHLPKLYRNPRLEKLKIWDLINHYGGFPKLPEFFGKKQKSSDNPYAYYTKEDLLTYYRDYVPDDIKNGDFDYSHTGYALLELIIEYSTKEDYHDLLEKYIFDPSDMHDSFIYFPEDRSIIQGYDRALRKVYPWQFNSFAASEGLKSTAGDLIKFMEVLLNQDTSPISESLSGSIDIEGPTNYNDKIFIGNGWHIMQQKDNYHIVTHTGKTSGHSAIIALVPQTKTGVAILSNSSFGTRDLGFLILRMINDNWNRKI